MLCSARLHDFRFSSSNLACVLVVPVMCVARLLAHQCLRASRSLPSKVRARRFYDWDNCNPIKVPTCCQLHCHLCLRFRNILVLSNAAQASSLQILSCDRQAVCQMRSSLLASIQVLLSHCLDNPEILPIMPFVVNRFAVCAVCNMRACCL